jgi:hypothetical protein
MSITTNEAIEHILVLSTLISPIVLALVQLTKTIIPEQSVWRRLIPVFSLILGILIGLLSEPFTTVDAGVRMWGGGLAGLSAVGLFESAKHIKSQVSNDK